MDIDHHNPTLKDAQRNAYENLFLSTRHCNGKKLDNWPSAKQRQAGIRFLNPCIEMDYGVHIFEDPDTFRLWGDTRAGRYHIRMLDLNAPHFIHERRSRDRIRKGLEGDYVRAVAKTGANIATGLDALAAIGEQALLMIRPIPQKRPPKGMLI